MKHNEQISKKRKKIRTTLNYVEHSLILTSAVTGCALIFGFDKIVLLAKSELSIIEVFVPKALINSHISHNEVALVNNVLREHNETK